MRAFFLLISLPSLASALFPNLARRLSEGVELDDPCVRTGFVVGLRCPDLSTGDLRTACATCAPLIARLYEDCSASLPLPPGLCSGDCASLLANETTLQTMFTSCESEACQTCFADASACSLCPSECLSYSHCWDEEADRFAVLPPPPPGPPILLSQCSDLEDAHDAHGCCGPSSSSFDGGVYVRLD